MKYCLALVLLFATVAAFSAEYQVIGGCTTLVVEGGTHTYSKEFPFDGCTLNYWPVTRTYTEDGMPDKYQCITTSQACHFKVDVPEEVK